MRDLPWFPTNSIHAGYGLKRDQILSWRIYNQILIIVVIFCSIIPYKTYQDKG